MKLTDSQKSFIQLIMRSPGAEDGWCNVSEMLKNFVAKSAAEIPELLELRNDGNQIRLSDKGKIIAAYL